jgi:hypothetical protein
MTTVFRALRPHEREECLDLWLTVWPGNREYFERYFFGDVEWLPYYTQVAECDGRLVSSVHICKRIVGCGDMSLTMGGIANVATLPEYRGRGYNAGCLKNAIEVMEADAMDFSLLFTGLNEYYRKFGYVDIKRSRATVHVRSDYEAHASKYLVRPAISADIPMIRRIYDSYNQYRPIAVRRSEAYWRDWIRLSPDNRPISLHVACDGSGGAVGYVYTGVFNSAIPYGSDEAEVRIIELCTDSSLEHNEEVVTHCLLNHVIELMKRAGTIIAEIAFTPTVQRVLSDIGGPQGVQQSRINSGMVRILHRDNLLNSVVMCSYDRWRKAEFPAGKLVFETPYGKAVLEAVGSQIKVCASDSSGFEESELISQSEIFGLLFGSLAANPEWHRRYSLLTALFPQQDMVYWGADGF